MGESGKKIGRILLSARLADTDLWKRAELEQKKTGRRVTEVLVALGIDGEMIRQALALRLKIPEVGLKDHRIEPEVLGLIPESWIQKHGIVPLERVENTLTLGTVDPFNIEIVKDIRFKTGLNVRVTVISEPDLAGTIEGSFGT